MSVGGRPTIYSKELHQAAHDYIEGGYKEHKHPIPSVIGMACVINVSKSTLYRWAESDAIAIKENRPEDNKGFRETLSKCEDFQHMALLHGGLDSTLNSTITKLALANHGYSDKAENTLQGPGGGPIEMDHTWQVEVVESDGD